MLVRPLTYRPTTVSSLFTAHSSQAESYTFASKERDEESGLSYFGARYYSSDLSIWLSVDPMSDKYPSLSPYVYCADNPVKLVDPNGEEIWIKEGDESYKYSNGKLYTQSGSEYIAKEGTFVYKAQTSINKIKNGGEVGKAMISELESTTSFSIKITDSGEGKSKYIPENDHSIDYSTGQVSGSATIQWNASGQEVPTTIGLRSDALMGLAHELSHGVDDKRGTMNTAKTKGNSWIGNHEWKAVYTENQIRLEQNRPLRTHYEIDMSNPLFPKGSGPIMINNNTPFLPQGVAPLF